MCIETWFESVLNFFWSLPTIPKELTGDARSAALALCTAVPQEEAPM